MRSAVAEHVADEAAEVGAAGQRPKGDDDQERQMPHLTTHLMDSPQRGRVCPVQILQH